MKQHILSRFFFFFFFNVCVFCFVLFVFVITFVLSFALHCYLPTLYFMDKRIQQIEKEVRVL